MALLDIRHLSIELGPALRRVRVVEDVSLSVAAGETMALVGESGCGKSVTALSIARLLPAGRVAYPTGEIWLESHDVLRLGEPELRALRGSAVSYVFQEPAASLNPVQRVGAQILEALKCHRPEVASRDTVVRLLRQVGIAGAESRRRDYPHQMSGGMQQRVMIAMALASQPRLLVADEPTTALDVTVQAQILDLLRELQQQSGMAIVLITHNLGLVRNLATRVAVMYAGQIVEVAPTHALLRQPQHPYTRALLDSVPRLTADQDRLTTIPGTVPRPGAFPTGCRFHPRCPVAQPSCAQDAPALRESPANHHVRCPFAVPPPEPARP